MFNPFKKTRKAPDMTTPENDPQPNPPSDIGNIGNIGNVGKIDGLNGLAGSAADAASAAGLPEAPPIPSTEQRLAELEAKHTEVADAYLRAKAEAENTRRRAEEDISKARKYAIESFAESLLPVRDSLEAAIALPDAKVEQVLEGVHATLRQLTAALDRN